MHEPFDEKFAQSLRESDRPLDFDWHQVGGQVRGKRTWKRNRQRMVVGVVCLLIGGLAIHWTGLFSDRSNVINDKNVAENQVIALPEQPESVPNLAKDTGPVESASELELFELGTESQSIEQLEQRLKSADLKLAELERIRSDQQWAIAKEVISRTEVQQHALAAYHY